MTDERKRLIALAKKYAGSGMSFRSDEFREVLGEAVPPFDLGRAFKCWQDPTTKKWHTQGVSTCALFAEGLWRLAGVEIPDSWHPYKPTCAIEQAIARAQHFALEYGACETYQPGLNPKPGDYVCIGAGTATHVLTALEWDDDTLASVDGGQVDNQGLQCSKICSRRMKIQGKEAFLLGRKINWWIDIDMIPWRMP